MGVFFDGSGMVPELQIPVAAKRSGDPFDSVA
jgi:hypothetical protein